MIEPWTKLNYYSLMKPTLLSNNLHTFTHFLYIILDITFDHRKTYFFINNKVKHLYSLLKLSSFKLASLIFRELEADFSVLRYVSLIFFVE